MGLYLQVDYTDVEGTAFKIEIDKPDHSGVVTQVQGKAVLEYPKVKTMDMLRGSSLKMRLEASSTDTWVEGIISIVGDKRITVTLYKGGSVFWNGFIKADGVVESFVSDYWIVNLQAIDGLGLLENTKFLNNATPPEPYQGSVSEIEILARCLELTGQTMGFRMYNFNLFFTVDDNDPLLSLRALQATYVNTDRYVKEDKEGSVFTAKEVLQSILKKYGAFVTQQGNMWHIVRIIDYFTELDSVSYQDFLIDGSTNGIGSLDPRTSLGSQIDSYDPHHANGNQQKNYKAAIGAYKVTYKYGFAKSILENPKIYFNDDVGDVDGWIVETGLSDFVFVTRSSVPGWPSGYYEAQLQPRYSTEYNIEALSNDYTTYPSGIDESSDITIEIDLKFYLDLGSTGSLSLNAQQYARITLVGDSGTDYYLNASGEWTLSDVLIKIYNHTSYSYERYTYTDPLTYTIKGNQAPTDGNIKVEICLPWIPPGRTDYGTYSVIENVRVSAINTFAKGESFTAQRNLEGDGTATAIVDVEDKIFVADSTTDAYIGAIENSTSENTILWAKSILPALNLIDDTKQFKLLNWLARDRMTISGGNSTLFKGGIYGYLPYLGVLTINNVTGVFMTVAWRYDTALNKIDATHERIFTDDIYDDVSVFFQLESDNIIRPAIE